MASTCSHCEDMYDKLDTFIKLISSNLPFFRLLFIMIIMISMKGSCCQNLNLIPTPRSHPNQGGRKYIPRSMSFGALVLQTVLAYN